MRSPIVCPTGTASGCAATHPWGGITVSFTLYVWSAGAAVPSRPRSTGSASECRRCIVPAAERGEEPRSEKPDRVSGSHPSTYAYVCHALRAAERRDVRVVASYRRMMDALEYIYRYITHWRLVRFDVDAFETSHQEHEARDHLRVLRYL